MLLPDSYENRTLTDADKGMHEIPPTAYLCYYRFGEMPVLYISSVI